MKNILHANWFPRWNYQDIGPQLKNSLRDRKIDLMLGAGFHKKDKYDTNEITGFGTKVNKKDLSSKSKKKLPIYGFFDTDNTEDDHIPYVHERKENDVSLSEMALFAMDQLDNEKGYFLLVEAGRIDHAHHENYPKRALEETI